MCGIAGYLNFQAKTDVMHSVLGQMTQALSHRGPDDEGHWYDPENGLGLGHRRLSIVDLSPLGHQPMKSESGRYVIALNGEIYNFKELRHDLETKSHQFRGTSDTEVLLAAIEEFGIERTLQKSVGMFAFALWDQSLKTLTLARDRLGEKPLYYGWAKKTFLFGSELKTFHQHPDFRGEIDQTALEKFMRYCYVPAPHSIFKEIWKLEPARYLTIHSKTTEKILKPISYWNVSEAKRQKISELDAIDELERLLKESVKLQMFADVPMGAFLSGGIDSSAIVALMQTESAKAIRTFSIGFEETEFNEAPYAKAVAEHLGTKHTEFYVSAADALHVIPELPQIFDEPFGDSSQIPTILLSRLTRQYVTVSLSGDGGDELFGGYNRYFLTDSIWKKISWMPHRLRQILSQTLSKIPESGWQSLAPLIEWSGKGRYDSHRLANKIPKALRLLQAKNYSTIYDEFISSWRASDNLVLPGPKDSSTNPGETNYFAHSNAEMMLTDLLTYLPDDILVKVDRSSMSASLELRAPFLDHRVVEFALGLPASFKIRNGRGKWILRELLRRHIPDRLIERPKMGFGVPIRAWMKGPLKSWAEDLLDPNKIAREGYLNSKTVEDFWKRYQNGQDFRDHHLWNILMFETWLERGRHPVQTTQGAFPERQSSSK